MPWDDDRRVFIEQQSQQRAHLEVCVPTHCCYTLQLLKKTERMRGHRSDFSRRRLKMFFPQLDEIIF